MKNPVGIAVLTNGNRRNYLEQNINAFLENTSYRPLVFGIFSNGSTDDTLNYLNNLPEIEGVEWRVKHSEVDMGCGYGVNRANEMIKEFEYSIFLECDWLLMREAESGISKEWLDHCLDFLKTGKADYIYLRRMRSETEAMFHHWNFVIANSQGRDGDFIYTEKFMYSNNPHIRRTKSLYENGTYPLLEMFDVNGIPVEKKGNAEWGQAEHKANHPKKLWIHRWGMFLHEATPTPSDDKLLNVGCNKYGPFGCSSCKYGFLQFAPNFCATCDFSKDFHDLHNHANRYYAVLMTLDSFREKIIPTTDRISYQQNCRKDEENHNGKSIVHHLDERKKKEESLKNAT